MKKLTFDQFAEIASMQACGWLRRGQAMLNKLDDFSNQIYSSVIDFGPNGIDPFHKDENIPAFLKYLLANHVELPVSAPPKGLQLRPETIKVGQFYRTTNKHVRRDNPKVLFLGAQTPDAKTHLILICPNKELYHGRTVKVAQDGDWSYWDSFYEVPAPTLES
jgi:hypothetical protein